MKKYNLAILMLPLMIHSLVVNGMYPVSRQAGAARRQAYATRYRQAYMRPSQNVQEAGYKAPYAGQMMEEAPKSSSLLYGERSPEMTQGSWFSTLWRGTGVPMKAPAVEPASQKGPVWNTQTSTWKYPRSQVVEAAPKRTLLYGERSPEEVKQERQARGGFWNWVYGTGEEAPAVVQEEVVTPVKSNIMPAKTSWSGWRPWRGTQTPEEFAAKQREKGGVGGMLYGQKSQTYKNQLITLLGLSPWASEGEIEQAYQEQVEGLSIPQVRRLAPKDRPAAVRRRVQIREAYENYKDAQMGQGASE